MTAFEYQLYPVGPALLVCSVAHPYTRARDAMRFYDDFCVRAPDELSVDAALVTVPSGERFFNISACYCGDHEAGEGVMRPLLQYGAPVEGKLTAVPYVQIQAGGDSLFPRGRRYYWKAQFLDTLTDAAIDKLLEVYARAPSTSSLLVFQHVGGAIARVPPTATPYGNRDARYDCFPISIWDTPSDDDAAIRWARDVWSAVKPFSTGGVYANNLGDEGEDRVRAAYGENHARMAAVKGKYDPSNFFRLNQNVRPSR